jgi:hypothetical protein
MKVRFRPRRLFRVSEHHPLILGDLRTCVVPPEMAREGLG